MARNSATCPWAEICSRNQVSGVRCQLSALSQNQSASGVERTLLSAAFDFDFFELSFALTRTRVGSHGRVSLGILSEPELSLHSFPKRYSRLFTSLVRYPPLPPSFWSHGVRRKFQQN